MPVIDELLRFFHAQAILEELGAWRTLLDQAD
jgi:hypothetical protein